MNKQQQPSSPTEVFIREIKSDGLDLDGIPVQMGKVGDFFGRRADTTAVDEMDESPVRITADNLPNLGGREVAADGLSVDLHVMGKAASITIEKLRFTRGTAHWPAQTRDQVPEIDAMVKLQRRLQEVQSNPKLKKSSPTGFAPTRNQCNCSKHC